MKSYIVIPARYASTRLPGKPLVKIAGVSMIERVWRLTQKCDNVDGVFIATDDERIVKEVRRFGAEAVMTDPEIENGTMRALATINQLPSISDNDVIFNLQGDAPVTPPWVIQSLIDSMRDHPDWPMATPAVQLSWQELEQFQEAKKTTPFSGTSVVFGHDYKALYFSKNIIPALRNSEKSQEKSPVFRHIGLYAYRYSALKKYARLKPSPLEKLEGLEQLRALENNLAIHVVPVDYRGRQHECVDSPEDIQRTEAVIAEHGEFN